MPKLPKRWTLKRSDRKKRPTNSIRSETRKDKLLSEGARLDAKSKSGFRNFFRKRVRKNEKALNKSFDRIQVETDETKKQRRFKLLRVFGWSKDKSKSTTKRQVADGISPDDNLAGSYTNDGFTDVKRTAIEHRVKDAQQLSTNNAQSIINIEQDVRNIEQDVRNMKQYLRRILLLLEPDSVSSQAPIGLSIEQSPSLNGSTDVKIMVPAAESRLSQADLDGEMPHLYLTQQMAVSWSDPDPRHSGHLLSPCDHRFVA